MRRIDSGTQTTPASASLTSVEGRASCAERPRLITYARILRVVGVDSKQELTFKQGWLHNNHKGDPWASRNEKRWFVLDGCNVKFDGRCASGQSRHAHHQGRA